MEGKRNRLKRKPKVSPVAQQVKDCLTIKQPLTVTGNTADGVDLIVIDEESPRADGGASVTTASRVETEPVAQHAGEQLKDKALHALAEVLMTLDHCRKRIPLELLPDLPSYQVPSLAKEDNTPSEPHDSVDDLPPLPKMCSCHIQHRRKAKTTSKPAAPDLVLPPKNTQHSNQITAQQNQHALSAEQDQETFRSQQVLHNVSQNQEICNVQQSQQVHRTASDPQMSTDLRKSTPLNLPSAANVPKAKNLHSNELSTRQAKLTPAFSRKDAVIRPSSSKPIVSSSGLFSKISTAPKLDDDMDEFEETNMQVVTNFTKTSRGKSVGDPTSQKRQLDMPSSNAGISKRRKIEFSCAKTTSVTVTKSLFPTKVNPVITSSSKASVAAKSQPRISSFSTKPSLHTNPKPTNMNPGSSFLGNTSVSTSRALSDKRKSSECALSLTECASTSGIQPIKKDAKGEERSHSAGGLSDRVKSCPLCQVPFSTAMSQFDIDAHIAACLSASTDDIVW